MSVREISKITKGRLVGPDVKSLCHGVSTDTRKISKGEMFVALKGDRFDGHEYISDAFAAGAVAAMADNEFSAGNQPGDGPLIVVDDTLKALQSLAASHRQALQMKVLGVTGSNGKTSTKDMAVQVLSSGFKTLGTRGNLNNHIGLPLSLLQADDTVEFGVYEMGMNHPGEIAPLAAMAAPDMAIVTNVGRAHIEYMETREAIAIEKAALLRSLRPDGIAILPANDEYLDILKHDVRARIVTAGIEAGDFKGSKIEESPQGTSFQVHFRSESAVCTLPLHGRHMVSNALLAIAAGVEAGITLEKCCSALSAVELTGGRLERKAIAGVVFLDDTYNANPDSVKAALQTLAGISTSRKGAVLGEMGELGKHSYDGHMEVGKACGESGLDFLVVVGEGASAIAEGAAIAGSPEIYRADDATAAAEILFSVCRPDDLVLVKGSRSAAMERVISVYAKLREARS